MDSPERPRRSALRSDGAIIPPKPCRSCERKGPTLHGKGAAYVCRNERKKEACLAALRKWKFSLATNDIRMGRKVLRCTHEGYTYAIKWLWMLRLHAILVALSLMQGGQVDK